MEYKIIKLSTGTYAFLRKPSYLCKGIKIFAGKSYTISSC